MYTTGVLNFVEKYKRIYQRKSLLWVKCDMNKISQEQLLMNIAEASQEKLNQNWDVELTTSEMIDLINKIIADNLKWEWVLDNVSFTAIDDNGKIVTEETSVLQKWVSDATKRKF